MDQKIITQYAPYLMVNDAEPFPLHAVGVSVLHTPGRSPSFRREIMFDTAKIAFVIEYALFWDYDVEHLFDLEHIWVFVGTHGGVEDCECSFHGKYMKGLRPDHTNVFATHPVLCCQPGKHGFAYATDVLKLDPHYWTAPMDPGCVNGLLITGILDGRMQRTPEIMRVVNAQLARTKFTPAERFHLEKIDDGAFLPWEQLFEEIPRWIQAELDRLFALEQ